MLPSAEFDVLAARMGAPLLRRRIAMETEQDTHHWRRESDAFHLEHLVGAAPLIRAALAASGLRGRGRRNSLDIRLRHHTARLASLPAAFEGMTWLHLSDLHLDLSEAHAQALAARVRPLRCDGCLLTGDYRFGTAGSIEAAAAALARLAPALPRPAFAVLGNHDSIRLAGTLEALGIRVLLNERVSFERAGTALHLAGIDDAHYFRTHDVARAAQGLPPGACALLLSHTPQTYEEAAAHGFAFMLCGHTHGGQICLPGGIPIVTDCPAPRRLARGAWRHGGMLGYTSAGCGCSIVEARFCCPPEVTLHTLRRAPATRERP